MVSKMAMRKELIAVVLRVLHAQHALTAFRMEMKKALIAVVPRAQHVRPVQMVFRMAMKPVSIVAVLARHAVVVDARM